MIDTSGTEKHSVKFMINTTGHDSVTSVSVRAFSGPDGTLRRATSGWGPCV